MLIFAQVSLNLVFKLIGTHVRTSCFCFESGIFTPEIGTESGKLIAVRCRFLPKVAHFGTLFAMNTTVRS